MRRQMSSFPGAGLHDEQSNAYRVIYIARLEDAVFVLHVFEKKTQAMSKSDIELAKARLQLLTGGR